MLRTVRLVVLPALTGCTSAATSSRDVCSDSVGARSSYPCGYTWFDAAEWKPDNRRSICWAKTPP